MSSRGDLTVSLVFLALAVGVCIGASRLGFGSIRAPEPGFFPWLGGLTLLVLSLGLLVQAARRTSAATAPAGAWIRPAVLLAALILYVPAFELFGYPLATTGLCAGALRTLGVRWRSAFGVGLGLAMVTFILFRRILGVELPPGVLAFVG